MGMAFIMVISCWSIWLRISNLHESTASESFRYVRIIRILEPLGFLEVLVWSFHESEWLINDIKTIGI